MIYINYEVDYVMKLNRKYNKKEYIEWLLTFLVIFYSGSAYAASINKFYAVFKYAFTFGILLIWFIKYKGIIRYGTNQRKLAIWIPVVWCCILFFNWIFHGDSVIGLISRMLHVIFAYEIVSVVSWESFKEKYVKIIIFICAVSLLFYFLLSNTSVYHSIMPQLWGYTSEGVLYTKYQGFLLYFNSNDPRNFGAFWEPGIFATHIILALLLLPYVKFNKYKKACYIILCVTILSTASSSGYVLLLMAIACNLISKIKLKEKKDILKVVFAIGIIVSLIIIYINLDAIINAMALGDNRIFKKMLDASNSERAESIRVNWNAFMQKPLLGYGYEDLALSDWYQFGIRNKIVIDTATTFRLLATLGIGGVFFTVILLIGIIKNKNISIFGKAVLIIITFLIINKEAHDSFLIGWCLMIYLNGREDYKIKRSV